MGNNIKMDRKGMEYGDLDWIYLADASPLHHLVGTAVCQGLKMYHQRFGRTCHLLL
jgi:hypothetical protein